MHLRKYQQNLQTSEAVQPWRLHPEAEKNYWANTIKHLLCQIFKNKILAFLNNETILCDKSAIFSALA